MRYIIKELGIKIEPYAPYYSDPNKITGCFINIDMDNYIDRYDYHDAPSSVDIQLNKVTLGKLIDVLVEAYKEMEE